MIQAPVLFLMGPTGSGKTALSLRLAEALPIEIVSVDSGMVYCGMDIGTAKPDHMTRARVPHHLIDIRDPSLPYSAAQFCEDARTCVHAIHRRGKLPVLVGGTMLYFHALQQGLSTLPEADAAVRTALSQQAQATGWPALHQQLACVDPQYAARIHPHDAQRIQRALEVYQLTGEAPSQRFQREKQADFPYRVLALAVAPSSRVLLHQRIADRLSEMLAAGFLEEVSALYTRGDLSADLPALRAVGYRQLWHYLSGADSYEQAVEKALFATRQLAKRQFTWLRKWSMLQWFEASDSCKIIQTVTAFIQ